MPSADTSSPTSVSVIGLGAMGQALARAFLDAGHPTTVWNRSPGRATELEAAGAVVASNPAEAVAGSALAILCVLDPPAVHEVLDAATDALDDATVVNLTSSVPDEAPRLAEHAGRAGARYLDGKIMVPTPLVGTDAGQVLYSGDRSVFDEHEDVLRALGPEADFLGEDVTLAALYDLAMLDVFFNGMTAFLHAAALVGTAGVDARGFLPYADRVMDVLRHTIAGLAEAVDTDDHDGGESNLVMELAALEHIVKASTDRGIDPTLPRLAADLARAEVAEGHGHDDYSRLIHRLRRPPRLAAAG